MTRYGGPEVLQVLQEELPEPGAGEIRVKVLAAGVSAYDLMQRRSGSLPGTPPLPYTPGEDIVGVVDKLGEGVDAVFDPVGGARQVWRSYKALRKGGRLVSFGMAATSKGGLLVIPATLLVMVLLMLFSRGKQASMSPNVGEFAPSNPDWYRETMAELLGLLAEGKIKPVVEHIPLVEAARAHELLERGRYAGKVVLVTNG